jgi:hypothetical protein
VTEYLGLTSDDGASSVRGKHFGAVNLVGIMLIKTSKPILLGTGKCYVAKFSILSVSPIW